MKKVYKRLQMLMTILFVLLIAGAPLLATEGESETVITKNANKGISTVVTLVKDGSANIEQT